MNRWPAFALIALMTACSPQAAQRAEPVKAFAVLDASINGASVTLSGEAPPGTQVLNSADSLATSGPDGRWSFTLPATSQLQSLRLTGRTGDALEAAAGPVIVLPSGGAVLLSPGAGATWLGEAGSGQTRLRAVDYDAEGGVIVSGHAPSNADILIRIEQARRGGGDANEQGWFSIVLNTPLTLGRHAFEVSGGGGEDEVQVDLSPPRSPAPERLSASQTAQGWRIDWVTPSGGLQTTLLIGAAQ